MGESVPIMNALAKDAPVHAPIVEARGPIRAGGAIERANSAMSSVKVASPTRAAYERINAGLETPAGSTRHCAQALMARAGIMDREYPKRKNKAEAKNMYNARVSEGDSPANHTKANKVIAVAH